VWAQDFARQLFEQATQDYAPNGQLLPASQGVAMFSPDQLAAQQMTEQLSGVAPNAGAGYINPQAGAPSNQNPATQGPTINTPYYQADPQAVTPKLGNKTAAPTASGATANQTPSMK
jgi:hypothetical protein